MKVIKLSAAALALVVIAAILLAALYQPTPLLRDPPRSLPWTLPDYRQANTRWEIDDKGRIHNQVEHFFLKGITPEMIAWFYQQLPISTVELNGITYPLYHIFHPTEHGRIRVLKAAPSGKPGMTQGAVIMREEWFGPYDSKGSALMTEFSNRGMVAVPSVAGIEIGRVEHIYQQQEDGTHYRVDAIIGAHHPLLGKLINIYIREKVFHPKLMAEWQRHQVEEVSSLQFYLPQLYSQRNNPDNHYILENL